MKSIAKWLLRILAWLLLAAGGLLFWVGGRAINEFAKTERILAEMEGVSLGIVSMGLGAVARAAANRLEEEEEAKGSVFEGDPPQR